VQTQASEDAIIAAVEREIQGYSERIGKETGLEVTAHKTKCMVTSQDQNAGRSHNIKIDNSSFARVEHFQHFRKTFSFIHFHLAVCLTTGPNPPPK